MPTPLLPALQILRPVNCLITLASVLLGGWLGTHAIGSRLLAAAVSASLIAGAGNALNDIWDIERDRTNRPDRPLPSGDLPRWAAWIQVIVLFSVGLLIAAQLPIAAIVIAGLAVLALILYNARLKDIPVAGNLLVSFLGGAAFIYGGASVHAVEASVIPACFAGIFHFGREVLKDLADLEGDRRVSGSTLPLRWGVRPALAAVSLSYIVLALATPIPFIVGLYGLRYLCGILLLDALLAYLLLALWRDRDPSRFRRLSALLKVGMVLGLGAILLDAL